jgi:hypothetical protein
MIPDPNAPRPRPVLAEAALRAKRLAICAECPHRKVIPLTKSAVCGKCGCPLASKTRFSRAHCPIGKW